MGANYTHARPRNEVFSAAVAAAAEGTAWGPPAVLPVEGDLVRLAAGDLLAVTLEEGPQIVHLDAWASDDPADRLWPQEISGVEGCFLGPGHRLWSTMPRFRPLLSVVGDTLGEPERTRGRGRHHLVLSGWDLPATWRREGGAEGTVTAWERFRALHDRVGVDPDLHRDALSLFQRTTIDPATGQLHRQASLARVGDRVVCFAEVDVAVALVPSPWRDGGRPAADCDGTVAAVSVCTAGSGLVPRGWPVDDIPYPDLHRYREGVR